MAENTSPSSRVLRHVVLFSFKPEATPEQIRHVEQAFCALPGQIDAIHDFEWGTDASVEGIAHGFTHCFLVTFRSEEDRAIYLPHPAHKAFGQVLAPIKQNVLVIDYWAER